MELFRSYNQYVRERYGKKGWRISVDSGFSCPNRSADRKSGGCTFCDPSGSRPVYLDDEQTLWQQIDTGIALAKRKYKAEMFFLYFQSYTSTYASSDKLEALYESALSRADFRELIISTRPDCLPEETINLLKNLKARHSLEVWVELGLQSIHDKTLERINRGHDYRQFLESFAKLKAAGIKVAIHLILGLPGENDSDIKMTLAALSELRPDGIKYHNLHIPEASPLFCEFSLGELPLIGNRHYLELVAWSIERLPPETIILRLTTDTPSARSGRIPGHFWNKQKFVNELNALLAGRGSFQGAHYNESVSEIS
jgi:radical SAM protein (TIGR01212 family)